MGRKLSGHGFYLIVSVSHSCVGIPQKKNLLLGSLAVLGKGSLEIVCAWNRCYDLYVFAFLFGALTGPLFHQVGTWFPPTCSEYQ